MDELVRISNGTKALHLASEHWARVEQELEAATAKLESREQELATALGRIAEQSEFINRLEQERNRSQLRLAQMAATVINMATVMVEGGREAREIISDIQHGQVETAAEELRTNGSG